MNSTNQNISDNREEPSVLFWKEKLHHQMPEDWREEIDQFETEIYLKKQGKIEDKIFAETRLRRGAYGQRYDNGQRHDGSLARQIVYPSKGLTKGPNTEWDAPGMLRIKIPYGGLTLEQFEVLADLAEEYSDGILHVTTRQDFQIHFIHIEDTPTVFRRLASVGITTKEACGNSIRNITGCPFAGGCFDEAFDTSPYADALFRFLLGHPDCQDFGRKVKIAFSGCADHPCALTTIHDIGLLALIKNGKKGFRYTVGGGLGAVPHYAQVIDDFVSEEEIFPLTIAIARIFARYGEKKNRNRARLKFLIKDWGIEKFKEEVFKERKILKFDSRWTDYLKNLNSYQNKPFKKGELLKNIPDDYEFKEWLKRNVRAQKQNEYCVVTIPLPLGDITSNQTRKLVDVAKKYVGDHLRTTVEQNLVLRWVSRADLYSLYKDLKPINLARPFGGTIVDITSCPGTDTCKLGTSSSRGLAGELSQRLETKYFELDEAIQNITIKVSGCFNSCGQHHIADIGFYGVSRKNEGYVVPHFQLVLGGQTQKNAEVYGLAIASIPSKAVPQTVEFLAEMYLKEKLGDESFQSFIKRKGKVEIKKSLTDLMKIPSHSENPSYYVDWADVREFTTSDIGVGECAGEVVSLVDFGLKEADRINFESQVALEAGHIQKAVDLAFESMLKAAQGLVKGEFPDVGDKPQDILSEFKKRFYDTEKVFDPFARDKFAKYFLKAFESDLTGFNQDKTRQFIEEAQLFIESIHACNLRLSMMQAV